MTKYRIVEKTNLLHNENKDVYYVIEQWVQLVNQPWAWREPMAAPQYKTLEEALEKIQEMKFERDQQTAKTTEKVIQEFEF